MEKSSKKDVLKLFLLGLTIFGISLIGMAKSSEAIQDEINRCLSHGGQIGEYQAVTGIFSGQPGIATVKYCSTPTPFPTKTP